MGIEVELDENTIAFESDRVFFSRIISNLVWIGLGTLKRFEPEWFKEHVKDSHLSFNRPVVEIQETVEETKSPIILPNKQIIT